MRRFVVPPAPFGLEPSQRPTFSVVIPTYQAAATIAEAVESALTQTVAPHEVIVVDDGSTDRTRSVLEHYRDRISYYCQANRGVAAALNAGIRHATGEFVSILNADDAYEPERIQALSELAAMRPDLDIVMTDAYFEVGGRIVSRFGEHTPFARNDQDVEIFERCFIAWPAVRREALIRIGGFDESLRIGEDWECWIRLLHAGSAAGLVDQPLMRYRIAGYGSLTDDRVAALHSRVEILERVAALDLSAAQRSALNKYLSRRRNRVLLAELEQAIRSESPGRRRRALRVAIGQRTEAPMRIRALAAALAPRVAAHRLAALEAKAGESRVRRGLPRA
jgi:glycosyltransferase involved in cell wall biosynthesis